MEVCGGQTHAIVRFGVDELLPTKITLVHGPGCPVCVTPLELIDKAIEIAARPGVIFCSFGDMLRVPGTSATCFGQGRGGDVRIVYSPLDAVKIAARHPDARWCSSPSASRRRRRPTRWRSSRRARQGLANFSMLVSHVLVPPAMEAILVVADSRVQGFLAAGHVCTVMGFTEYEPLARAVPRADRGHRLRAARHPAGRLHVREQLEEGRAEVENQYTRVVRREATAGAAADPRGLPSRAPEVARHRRDPAERAGAARRVCRASTPSGASACRGPGRRAAECISG